jgi:hypothetical protein
MKIFDYDFQFQTTGTLQFDPGIGTKHFEHHWCILLCDEQIADYYRWFLTREKIETFKPNALWSFHMSIIKGEEPTKNKDQWAKLNGQKVTFHYGNFINYSNGRHAWLNCYSDDLSDIREFYGLDTNGRKVKYHMTLGRLKKPWEEDVKKPGTIYKGENLDSI